MTFDEYEEKENKVWIYYFNNYLYAFTSTKKFAKLFEKQRDMRVFHKVKKKLSNLEFSLLSSTNSKQFLVTDYLYTGTTDVEVVVTPEEASTLDDVINHIQNELMKINAYPSVLEELPQGLMDSMIFLSGEALGIGEKYLLLNTFELFIDLYHYTFMEGGLIGKEVK